MFKNLKTITLFVSSLLLLLFALFVISQTAQVVQLADRIHPMFGTAVLWLLLVAYLVLIAAPIVLFLRLPAPLSPPSSEQSPEFETHLAAVKKRLARNPHVEVRELRDRASVETTLASLNLRADKIIRESASVVFLSTAISQNGRLDTFLVLSELTRLIWRISHAYDQRPTLRDLVNLYGNVAGTAFVAGTLDDIDISEQIAPVLGSVAGGAIGAIPGLQAGAAVFVNSITSGAANAFLTLRVGILTKRYCGSLVLPEKRALRRAASAEAARFLGAIVAEGAGRVAKAVMDATRDTVTGKFSEAASLAKTAGSTVLSKARPQRRAKKTGQMKDLDSSG